MLFDFFINLEYSRGRYFYFLFIYKENEVEKYLIELFYGIELRFRDRLSIFLFIVWYGRYLL